MKSKLLFLQIFIFFCSVCFVGEVFAENKIKIVTTTSTFASIAKEIAGDKADIYFIAAPNRDIHFIAPTPRDVLKTKKADVFIHGGLDLEMWRGPLLDAAGRREFMGEAPRAIDVSRGVPLLEVPETLSRAQGDIHAFGNPHYGSDPENGRIIAKNIAEGLAKIYPGEASFFLQNAAAFDQKLADKIKEWGKRMEPYKGTPVVTYHDSWPYFAKRFGFEVAGYLEPKPGIPPTARHFEELKQLMREKKIPLILKESFQESKMPQKLAHETGSMVVVLSQSVGENKESPDYISMVESNIKKIETAMAARSRL